jgi:hypothetical protein
MSRERKRLACGQKTGANAMMPMNPIGTRTAEKTRLKASKALSSRTNPVAFRVKSPPGAIDPAGVLA